MALRNRGYNLDTTDFLATDPHNSVLGIYSTEPPLHHAAYSPYGFSSPELKSATIIGYNGEKLEPTSLLYFLGNGHRAFNSELGRFNSSDSMSPFAAGGLNAYCYCFGDPINLYDPSGRAGVSPWFEAKLRATRKAWLIAKSGRATRSELENIFNRDMRELRANTPTARRKFGSQPSLPDREAERQVPKGWDLIGYHGSRAKNTPSLVTGLDPIHLKQSSGDQEFGDGFYISPFDQNSVYSTPSPDYKRHYVYTQNAGRLRLGRDFDFSRENGSVSTRRAIQIVIREPAYESIIIRSSGGEPVVPPRSKEAPF